MILTGKAKQDFENWLKVNCDTFAEPLSMGIGCSCGNNFDYDDIYENVTESMQHALIFEWLYSVGTHVIVYPCFIFERMLWDYTIYDKKINTQTSETRNEATKAAILTANDIYNEQHNNH